MAGYSPSLDALLQDGADAIACARALEGVTRATWRASFVLGARSSGFPGPSPLSGGSAAATVTDLILSRSVCDACLAKKTGLSAEHITAVLLALARHFVVTRSGESCDECGTPTTVHRLG